MMTVCMISMTAARLSLVSTCNLLLGAPGRLSAEEHCSMRPAAASMAAVADHRVHALKGCSIHLSDQHDWSLPDTTGSDGSWQESIVLALMVLGS